LGISSLLRQSDVRRLVVGVVVGGLSIGLAPLGLVLFVRDSTGSFTAAGAVLGAVGLGRAVATPLQGRLLDRLGARRVLVPSAAIYALGMLGLLAAGEMGGSVPGLLVAATVAGVAFPPFPAILRASWPKLVGDDEAELRTAYALDAIVNEALFFIGLGVAGALVAVGRPAIIVATMAVTAVAGCAILLTARVFAAPSTIVRRDLVDDDYGAAGPLSIGPLRLALATWVPVGFCLAVFEVIAPAFAVEKGAAWAGGLLLALTGVGNIAGVLWFNRTAGNHDDLYVLGASSVLLAAMLALTAAPDGFVAMGLAAVLLGAPHGPFVVASAKYAAALSPSRMLNETFTWSTTAIMIGGSAGGAVAGALVDATGWRTASLISAASAVTVALLLWVALTRTTGDAGGRPIP
jgi:MFS family permease